VVLAAHRGTADAASTDWKAATYQYIQDQIQEGIEMTVLRMCQLGQVSRAGLYRFDPDKERRDHDLDLRDAIQRIALEFPCYGRPKITAELRRQGWQVNHKRVGRIMREDNLLCIRRRKFVCTTDSKHSFPVYPNLAGKMELTGIDQLWVADITYIRLETIRHLAVVLRWRSVFATKSCKARSSVPIDMGQVSRQVGMWGHPRSDGGVADWSTRPVKLLRAVESGYETRRP
jgi:hypothetical protein